MFHVCKYSLFQIAWKVTATFSEWIITCAALLFPCMAFSYFWMVYPCISVKGSLYCFNQTQKKVLQKWHNYDGYPFHAQVWGPDFSEYKEILNVFLTEFYCCLWSLTSILYSFISNDLNPSVNWSIKKCQAAFTIHWHNPYLVYSILDCNTWSLQCKMAITRHYFVFNSWFLLANYR